MSTWIVIESIDGIVTNVLSFTNEPFARQYLETKKFERKTDVNLDSIGYHYSTESKRGYQLWVL